VKDFIYLDTDYLNSYLAQINNGLLTKVNEESGDSTQNTEENTEAQNHNKVNGKLGIALASIASEITSDDEYTKTIFSETETARKMVERVMQDNTYELFVKHAKDNNLICEGEKYEIGEYVLINNAKDIFDIGYYQELSEKGNADSLTKCMLMPQEQIIEKLKKEGNNSQQLSIEKKKLVSQQQQFSDIFGLLSTVSKAYSALMPTKCTLFANNTLIPLKENLLRESFKEFYFKYGERLNVFGRITKIGIGFPQSEENQTLINSFRELQNSMIPILQSCGFPVNENTYIMSPIALYFE
jgi:hypothetical protein